jgi:hypothetical protein
MQSSAAAAFFWRQARRHKPALLGELVTEQERRGDRLSAARLRTLWSLSLWNSGENAAAVAALQPVLQLAAQQHLKRIFLDAGETLQPLLVRVRETAKGMLFGPGKGACLKASGFSVKTLMLTWISVSESCRYYSSLLTVR